MGFVQLSETISNVCTSIDAEEVSGSNPLSPTLKIFDLQVNLKGW